MIKMNSPLVSVIISFLNEERFLSEAIDSVLAQSYSEWELFLVDDGSTDSSSHIAKKYATLYPRKITYLDHEDHQNRGLSYSRNSGIAASKGDLIAILDADDIWLKHKLKSQVEIILRNPETAMLCEASLYWKFPWNNPPDMQEIIQVGAERNRIYKPFELIRYLYPLSIGDAPCPSGLIMRREPLLRHGGFESHFTGKYQLYEDQALLHKFYLHEYVFVSSACNNLYRQREGSLVRKITENGDYHSVRKYFLEWLDGYIKEKNLYNRKLKILLEKALLPYRKGRKNYLNRMIEFLFTNQ